jgi:hypothetical protein
MILSKSLGRAILLCCLSSIGCSGSEDKTVTLTKKTEDVTGTTSRTSLLEVPSRLDAGPILLGNDQEFSVPVTNRGSSPIAIHEIATSCTCTKATIGKPILEPGESTEIVAVIKPSVLGASKVNLKLYDSGQSLLATIPVHYAGASLVIIEPKELFFGRVPQGTTSHAKLLLRGDASLIPDWSPSQLLGVEAYPSDEITITTTETEGQLEVGVELKPRAESGKGKGGLVIRFPQPIGDVRVKADWTVVEDVEVQPSRIFLGRLSIGEAWNRQVTVSSSDFEITKTPILSSGDDVECTEERLSATAYHCKLSGAAPNQPGPFTQVLTLDVYAGTELRQKSVTVSGIVE